MMRGREGQQQQWALALLLASALLLGGAPPGASAAAGRDGARLLRAAWGDPDTVLLVEPGQQAPAGAPQGLRTMTLLDALRDPNVTTLLLTSNYSVGPEFTPFTTGQPALQITRNITLKALPGLVMPQLDFQFLRSAVRLCASCFFNMSRIVVANERRGSGAAVDFFMGERGSVLVLQDSYRLRPACTTTDSTMELINKEQPRSPRFPSLGPGGRASQWLEHQNVTFQGTPYLDQLWLIDYSYDVPAAWQEGRGLMGGFNMRTINTTRLCRNTVSAACLRVKAPEVCVNELIDQLSEQRQQEGSGTGNVRVVAIVVPVVAGVLLPAAALAAWLIVRHHRRQQAAAAAAVKASGLSLGGGSVPGRPRTSCSGSHSQPDLEEGSSDPFIPGGDVPGSPRVDQGWTVVAVKAVPELGPHVCNSKIHFGVLLGAGSFGRVYRGRWAGMEVAVKCIEHDSETVAAVQNEVQLMMTLSHPNIIKAYHYITYRHNVHLGGGGSNGDKTSGDSQPPAAAGTAPSHATDGALASRQQLQLQLQQQLGPKQQQQLNEKLGFSSSQADAPTASSRSSTDVALPGTGDASGSSHHCIVGLVGTPSLAPPPPAPLRASSSSTSSTALTACGTGLPGSPALLLPNAPSPQQQQQQQQPGSSSQHLQAWDGLLPPDQQQQQQHPDLQAAEQELLQHAASGGSQGRWSRSGGSAGALGLTPTQKASLRSYMSQQEHLLLQHTSRRPRSRTSQRSGAAAGGAANGAADGKPADASSGDQACVDLQRSRTYIVQEYADLGTLSRYAAKAVKDPGQDEQLVKLLELLQDAARGLVALHRHNVVHGDVNARNVLVCTSTSAPHGAVAKLADLGLSRVIRQHSTHRTTNTVGTLSHMPPELLRHGRMSPAVDIYSFGVMLWEVFTGQPAFRNLHVGQIFEYICIKGGRPNVPEDMPRDYSLLMLRCWTSDPAERPTAERLLDCLSLMLADRQEGSTDQPWLAVPPAAAAAAAGSGHQAAAVGEPQGSDSSSDCSSLHLV